MSRKKEEGGTVDGCAAHSDLHMDISPSQTRCTSTIGAVMMTCSTGGRQLFRVWLQEVCACSCGHLAPAVPPQQAGPSAR